MEGIASKFTALGNDYIVIDPNKSNIALTESAIRKICDRNYGIGSDGILYGPLNMSDNSLRIFNPDGTECEKSGNGLRIFSDYLYQKGYVKSESFSINLPSEKVDVYSINKKLGIYKINMGTPRLCVSDHNVKWPHTTMVSNKLAVNGKEITASFISIGNPHLVVDSEDPSAKQAKELGPAISNMDIFPERTNVQFCKVITRNRIKIEIYERGAGYTLASGSSSCAAAAAMYFQNKVDSKLGIEMPGGILEAEFNASGNILLTGQSQYICDVIISENFSQYLKQKRR